MKPKALAALVLVLAGAGLGGCRQQVPQPQAPRQRPSKSLVFADVTRPDVVPAYLAVCPAKAIPKVMALLRWRDAHALPARVAPAEAVYEAFGNGQPDAKAIRAFIHSLRRPGEEPPRVRFCLLVGTADRANRNGLYLPTWYTRAKYQTNEYPADPIHAGDYLYSVGPGARGPEIAVGRLPARSLDEVAVMVRKTLEHERHNRPGPWRRRAYTFAGQGGFGPLVDTILERLVTMILGRAVPNYMAFGFSYAKPASPYCYSPARFSSHIAAELARGPAAAVYIGHGSVSGFDDFRWRGRSYRIMDPSAVSSLQIPHHRTVVVSIACHTGRFDGPTASIGERFLTAPGGPALFIGSSRISQPYANAILGSLVTEAFLSRPPPTVGEAFLKVRQWLAADRKTGFRVMVDMMAATQLGRDALAPQRADQLTLYNILGDPAMSMGVVRTPARLTAPASAAPGQTVEILLEGPVAAGKAEFSLTVSRDRMLGDVQPVRADHPDAENEMARTNARANDKVVAAETVEVSGGRARWKLRIPDDCPAGTLYVNAYAWGRRADAAASAAVRIEPAAE